ncbi:MAG: preprotein translocase subunit YajC [Actinobacteria bacterium]|nr:preprotein translocase subunit YajC [Actinomycetota bacterium]
MPALLVTIVFIAIGWFLIIRPQQQRMREQRDLVASLTPGDQVITAGGIHGELISVDEETVELRVADGVVLTIARPAIARRIDETAGSAEDEA